MSDDLLIPEVPEPKPEDPEDVSWALSTAEAMWARGDHLEGIKWVRRAAEAASEAEDDSRALELAKAAADLTGLISRQVSRASIEIEEVDPMSDPSPPAAPQKPANRPPPPKPAAVAAAAAAPRAAVAKSVGGTPSRPPAPLPSKTSHPPPGGAAAIAAGRKPLGTNATGIGANKPASMRPGAKKSRRSRENLDAEARAAFPETDAAQKPVDVANPATPVLSSDTSETAAIDVPAIQKRRMEDPTVASNVNDIVNRIAAANAAAGGGGVESEMGKSTDEWDASPTQNLSGDDLPFPEFHRSDIRNAGASPAPASGNANDFKTTMQSFPRPGPRAPTAKGNSSPPSPSATPAAVSGTNPPATVVGSVLAHAQQQQSSGGAAAVPRAIPTRGVVQGEQHDPGIVTTQAVRVVVWRDANGVHVAPAGTVVSAITVEAVLVAFEPHADLTAWLSAMK